jgi:hypothetical protein
LRIDELDQVGDAVVRKEIVICCSIQAWAWASNIVGSWSSIGMCGVTISRYLIIRLTRAKCGNSFRSHIP